MDWQIRFDRLLKSMSQGEAPGAGKMPSTDQASGEAPRA